MISFELKKSLHDQTPQELEVCLDRKGLESLLAQLRFLEEKRTDHVHLMSISWGGTHLEDQARSMGGTPIHHVKISLV